MAKSVKPAKMGIGLDAVLESTRKIVLATRLDMNAAAKQFAGFREKIENIAPRIIGAFNTEKAAHEPGQFGLADFARLYDPAVPMTRGTAVEPGYAQDRTYMALEYMKRQLDRKAAAEKRNGAAQPRQRGVFNGLDKKLERVIKTVLSAFSKPEDQAAIWTAIGKVFNMQENTLQALKNRTSQSPVVLDLSSVLKQTGKVSAAKLGPVVDAPAAAQGVDPGAAELIAQAGKVRARKLA